MVVLIGDHIMNPELKSALDTVLSALDRLMQMFKAERVIHLVVAIFAFLMLMVATIQLMTKKEGLDMTQMGLLFGSSGLVTLSGARVTFFFSKSFGLIEEVTRALIGLKSAASEVNKG